MYWLTGIVGFLFIVAPFVLGYADNSFAFWTSMIIGGSVTIASLMERYSDDTDRWEYTFALLAGIIAITAPFVLGFSSSMAAMWTSIIAGLLLALTAGTKLYYDGSSFV